MIIFTVPHSFCLPWHSTEYHLYDLAASRAVSSLAQEANNQGVEYRIVMSNIDREIIDLNRVGARNTSFRKEIRSIVSDDKDIIIMDIHSYPDRHSPDDEIYIIDDSPVMEGYVYSLYSYLRDRGIHLSVYRGHKNDIMDEFREKGYKALLIEFNEGLSPDRMKTIARYIVEWHTQ